MSKSIWTSRASFSLSRCLMIFAGVYLPFSAIPSLAATPLPDLVVELIMSPAAPTAGQKVTFSAIVTNKGTAATPAKTEIGVGFFVQAQGGQSVQVAWSGSSDTSSLLPGKQVTIEATGGPNGIDYWNAAPGKYTFTAKVNIPSRFPESNANNNTDSKNISVAGAASNVSISSGSGQTGTVGLALAKPFTALVTDANGIPVPNANVAWKALTGGGKFADASTPTDAQGIASSILTLGTVSGSDTASATIGTGAVAKFSATANPGTATTLAKTAGDNQSAPAGSQLSLSVSGKDQYGNVASPTQINWAATGGGTLASATTQMANGVTSDTLTLGWTAGSNAVTATIQGTKTSVTFNETGTAVNPQPVPSGPSTPGSITLSPGTIVGKVPRGMIGFSFDKVAETDPIFTDPHLVTLFNLLGAGGTLRIGGTDVDYTTWNPGGSPFTETEVSDADITALGNFANKTDWNVIYGVNLLNYPPATAAAEIATAAKALGNHLTGVEIGNEPNTYLYRAGTGITGFYCPNQGANCDGYFNRWQATAAKIASVTPNLPLTGPAGTAFNKWGSPWTKYGLPSKACLTAMETGQPVPATCPTDWLTLFLMFNQAGPEQTLVKDITMHWYAGLGWEGNPPVYSNLTDNLFPAEAMPNYFLVGDSGATRDPFVTLQADIQTVIRYFASNGSAPLPLIWDETSSFNDEIPDGTESSQGSALWTIDHLFNGALGGAIGETFICDPANDPTKNSPFGFNSAYDTVASVRPQYYGMLLFSMAGQGNLIQTSVATALNNTAPWEVTAYTVLRSDNGELSVIINNKDTQNLQFTLNVGQSASSATLIQMTGALLPGETAPSSPLMVQDSRIQGSAVGVDGSFDPGAAYHLPVSGTGANTVVQGYVNAASAALITIKTE